MSDALAPGGAAMLVGALALWVAGPLGMFVCGLVLALAGTVVGSGTGADGDEDAEKVNCPDCGAVNAREDDRCYDCESELAT